MVAIHKRGGVKTPPYFLKQLDLNNAKLNRRKRYKE